MGVRFLVIGKSGQLARALAKRDDVVALGRESLNLADTPSIAATLDAHRPAVVINAAAYTAVDRAESEPEAAFALNRDGPATLARLCAARGAPLVHVSTDYVFDGAKSVPYVETDSKAPLQVYGRSKSEGEDAVLAAHEDCAILRTSWVYAAEGANFVRTMLRLSDGGAHVRVVADQHGRPTYADDLADACIAAAGRLAAGDATARGLFHFAGGGEASWADFAEAIFSMTRRATPVTRITTVEFPTPARRPANSRLDTSKFERTFDRTPRSWRAALQECLAVMNL